MIPKPPDYINRWMVVPFTEMEKMGGGKVFERREIKSSVLRRTILRYLREIHIEASYGR